MINKIGVALLHEVKNLKKLENLTDCPACDGDGKGRSRKNSDLPDKRTKCKTCAGKGKVEIKK